jgi:hypothetical protein
MLAAAASVALFVGGVATERFVFAAEDAGVSTELPAYLLLLYGGETTAVEAEAARVAEYAGWGRRLADRGQLVAADRLAREEITFGPALAAGGAGPVGFFLIRAATLDDARAAGAECPHLKYGGTVVIRPIH